MQTNVGSVQLPSPFLPASGTAGTADELADYLDYELLGAYVPKSLHHEVILGNPAPRVTELQAGMMNSVGLPGPGVAAWLQNDLPKVLKHIDRVVAPIWGTSIDDFAKAAKLMSEAPDEVLAVEVNVSCPNTDDANKMFAASAKATGDVVRASAVCGKPMWAKLSPSVPNIVEIAGAAFEAGAEAVVLSNTMPGMKINIEDRTFALGIGSRGGGVSGIGIHPIVTKLIYDVRAAFPDKGIVGIGGVSTGEDAIEFFMAGANAVGVGTALFHDPRSISRIHSEVVAWCAKHNVTEISQLVGAIHDRNNR